MWCHKGQVDEGGTIQSKSLVGIPTSPLLEVGYNGEMTITPFPSGKVAHVTCMLHACYMQVTCMLPITCMQVACNMHVSDRACLDHACNTHVTCMVSETCMQHACNQDHSCRTMHVTCMLSATCMQP